MGQFPEHGDLARRTSAHLRGDVGGPWRCFGPSRNSNWTENTTTAMAYSIYQSLGG